MERASIFFLWLAAIFFPIKDSYSNSNVGLGSRSEGGLIEIAISANTFSVFEENGKVGLKDEKGEILIPATYEAIGWSHGKLSIVDKVVGYQSNGLWGLIHTANKLITAAEFLELKPGEGSFLIARKKSPLSQRASYGVINTAGKTVIPFSYDALQLSNMRAVVMSRTLTRYNFGLIDLSNKILIPIQYQHIYSLGSLRYAVENSEGKIALFSDEGKQVTNFLIDSISSFKKDLAIVYQNQRQGLISRNGEIKLDPTYREILLRDDGSIRVRQTDSWFFLDGENKLIKQYHADSVKALSPDHYAVSLNGKLQLTDNAFKPLNTAYFSSLNSFNRESARYQQANLTGLINANGKIIIPARYDQLIRDQNFLLACIDIGHKKRWVVLDSTGNTLTEKHYEHIAPFNGKFFPVRNKSYWGAVNARGKEIIACVHDSLVQQAGDLIAVKFKGKYGIIDCYENWIVTPQENPLGLLSDERYFEYAGNTTFLKSFAGDIIYFSGNPLEFKGGYLAEHLPSGSYMVVDLDGVIIDRSLQPENVDEIFPESEGLRAIRKDGKYGFIDDRGRLRIANRYEAVKKFSNGLAAIRIRNKWGFIDHHERLVVQPVYDKVENFRNGYAIVSQNNLLGLVDQNGKIVLPVRYEEMVPDKENRFLLKQNGLYGLADAEGNIIINPKYDTLTDTSNGYVIVQRDGKYGLLTLRGVSTIPMIYDGLSFDAYHNQYLALKKSAWEIVSREW